MAKRIRINAKGNSRSKCARVASAPLALFAEPPLLPSEDADAYEEFVARVRAEVNPADTIDEMFIADVVNLEWEVLRWRRWKNGLIRARLLESLKDFLSKNLEYQVYRHAFLHALAEALKESAQAQQKDFVQTLVGQCAQNEPEAFKKVAKILATIGRDLDKFLDDVRAEKAEALVQEYAGSDPDAVTLVGDCLAGSGVSMDSLLADALGEQFDYIERLDYLTTIAENRRNAALREIDRRRAVLGETVRSTVQEIEDAEFKVIETTPAKGKDAA